MTPARLIIEVRWGSRAGQKHVLAPGKIMRIGRTDRADLILAHDAHVSGIHAEITWDGDVCMVRDNHSAEGTFLDGEAIGEASASHGAWVRVGDTNLMLYMEGRTPARAESPLHSVELVSSVRSAIAVAVGELPMYGVLDAARDERILELLRQHVEPHRSLYDGTDGDALEDVAPYLVGPMDSTSMLLDRLLTEGWGRRWGIFLGSASPFTEIRRQLRRNLMVELESSGKQVYFRFYDPIVFRSFLDHASLRQKQLFGGGLLRRASFEDETGKVLVYSLD